MNSKSAAAAAKKKTITIPSWFPSSFISKNSLRIHVRSIHERHYRQVCHICAKVYNSKHSLLMHLKNHSEVKEPRVTCRICGRSYKNVRGLNSHIATHNQGNQIFQCPHCPRISPNRNALAKHIGSIHNFKIHKCHLCDREFKRALVLKVSSKYRLVALFW